MEQSSKNVRMSEWFAHEGDRESNWKERNKSVIHEEVDKNLPAELVCNPSESGLIYNRLLHSLPTTDVDFGFSKYPQIPLGGVTQDKHDAIHDPNTSGSNSISVKGTQDVENYMKDGIGEEELLKVVKRKLPHNFHGVILEEDIQKQKENGLYLIRVRENKSICTSKDMGEEESMEVDDHCTAMDVDEEGEKTFDHCTAMDVDEEGEKTFDHCTAMDVGAEGEKTFDHCTAMDVGEEGEKTFDHCTAMVKENDYNEYFDPAGKVPLNLEPFFSEYNRRQLQSSDNKTCAFHCTLYLVLRSKGLSLDQIYAFYTGNLEENDRRVTEAFTKFELNIH